jgi:hypothetical protein
VIGQLISLQALSLFINKHPDHSVGSSFLKKEIWSMNLIELVDGVMLLLKVFTIMDGQTTNYSDTAMLLSKQHGCLLCAW